MPVVEILIGELLALRALFLCSCTLPHQLWMKWSLTPDLAPAPSRAAM